jgi:hypothetical protein
MANNQAEETAADHQGIHAWVKEHLAAEVKHIHRQRRWRPVWRVEAEKSGEKISLLFKGTRAWDDIPYSLDHEFNVMKVLENNGIPVPKLHGMCEQPKAIVMSWVKGGRDPGLVVEALEKNSEISPDRWQASLRYMEYLAKMHSIDPAQFVEVGCEMPVGDEAASLNGYERFYQMLVDRNIEDPFIEFCTAWLRRNVPKHRPFVSFTTGDCGQFLSDGPDITAIIDMEVGHLCDHFGDLACFRGRHPVENMGDVRALFEHYAKALGQPLDLDAIAFQTVVFLTYALFTPIMALDVQTPGGDWVEAALQMAFIGRRASEALAEIIDVELDDAMRLPPPRVTPMEDMAVRKLIFDIERLPLSENLADWQRSTIANVPNYLSNQLHYGVWVQECELDDLVPILGYRPADIVAGDKALTKFVHAAGPEQDAMLVKYFHKRQLRLCHVFAGPNPPHNHLVLMKVEPILHQ